MCTNYIEADCQSGPYKAVPAPKPLANPPPYRQPPPANSSSPLLPVARPHLHHNDSSSISSSVTAAAAAAAAAASESNPKSPGHGLLAYSSKFPVRIHSFTHSRNKRYAFTVLTLFFSFTYTYTYTYTHKWLALPTHTHTVENVINQHFVSCSWFHRGHDVTNYTSPSKHNVFYSVSGFIPFLVRFVCFFFFLIFFFFLNLLPRISLSRSLARSLTACV